jgi:hypothetical protein
MEIILFISHMRKQIIPLTIFFYANCSTTGITCPPFNHMSLFCNSASDNLSHLDTSNVNFISSRFPELSFKNRHVMGLPLGISTHSAMHTSVSVARQDFIHCAYTALLLFLYTFFLSAMSPGIYSAVLMSHHTLQHLINIILLMPFQFLS